MKTLALLVAIMLATAMATASARTLDEPSVVRGTLGRKIASEEEKEEGNYNGATALGEIVLDIETLRTTLGLTGEDVQHVDELRMTESTCGAHERCDKKKVVYARKCTDSAGKEVDALHPAVKKCVLRFKKCNC